MNTQSEDNPLANVPDNNMSPVYTDQGNLYISDREWKRLCAENSTAPLQSVLSQVRDFLTRGKSVRLVRADGGIAVSADRNAEFQAILDNANRYRASLALAPVIPVD